MEAGHGQHRSRQPFRLVCAYPNSQRQASTEIGNGDLLKPRPALGRHCATGPPIRHGVPPRQALDEGLAKLNLTLKQNQANTTAGAGKEQVGL